MENIKNFIKDNTIRLEASRRGGGIEIDVSSIFGEDCKMSAYQNYLGGGLLGAVCCSCNFETKKKKELDEISDALKRYYHEITNEEAEEYDEWNGMSYEKNQNMPISGY